MVLVVPLIIGTALLIVLNINNRNTSFLDEIEEILDTPIQFGTDGWVKGNIGFVLAHPDDESMFFTPTLEMLNELRRSPRHSHVQVHLLSLSNGNYYGRGERRVEELQLVCKRYNVQCTNVDSPKLQDGDVYWSIEECQARISEFINKNKITLVFTFDEKGVSGHANHITTCIAVRNLVNKENIPLHVWNLETPNILFKYMGILNAIMHITSRCVIKFAPFHLYSNMTLHASQMRWHVPFWSFLSSFAYVNNYTRSMDTVHIQPQQTHALHATPRAPTELNFKTRHLKET
ncbi:bifunctional N-acetylglucosaminyl phosphatidylinositol deacetylase-related/putative deacetylase LmbE-like domain superfamily/N-acetylglucosaminyl-phosphatidylinositol de-N-acetylase [Babesia duncani]|uniref:N-acetylglucosaminylphosphatidylinositol deacetylase n=1 Tax=Babesia duncani TaxID=323732 RepID=A0AAD9PL22_9APIC|nr:bifunctional N-acetylglucosaminyl phosphatidylinositol deacetylase-related/putative deacetylase LmbE-like domain superfamily/N-acetylglucosaminyl-phosphatidylinositol de-N-acetylase [Babesia duncani]